MAEFIRIQSVEREKLHVIELRLPQYLDAVEFDEINASMLSLLNGKADQKWVLDLSSVSYMGSAMLGTIVNIRQRIKSGGGRLVLCGMAPRLLEIFRACSMERLFTITRNRAEAMKAVAK